jgi:hypothetical protein
MTSHGPWVSAFPGNFVWSNAALVTKGMTPYGAVALGEIDEVCERLKPRQGDPDAWREEWCAMGARLERVAATAAAARITRRRTTGRSGWTISRTEWWWSWGAWGDRGAAPSPCPLPPGWGRGMK